VGETTRMISKEFLFTMSQLYTSVKNIDFTLSDLESMPMPHRVLMVKPSYFDVEYVINPHMKGQIGKVDNMRAKSEWDFLVNGFKELGFDVQILDGEEGLPDMVFCANQSLPYSDGNTHKVIMSRMFAEQRKGEVPIIEKWFEKQGYDILHLSSDNSGTFEGMGDALWHPKKKLLWGGYGYRTSVGVYSEISDLLEVPVILLELVDERFYHLDTCMCMLNSESVLIYPDAFSEESLELIYKLFKNVIESGSYEAEKLFSVNAVCPDGKHVMIQQGCTDVNKKLRDAGFSIHEFSTYQFLKSGGSVFCMKLLYW
jgi:N-dimethylarginine dimethylaminohydrolase